MARRELSDDHYLLLAHYLRKPEPPCGHSWSEHLLILYGLFWKLHTGAQWRYFPDRYGSLLYIHSCFLLMDAFRSLP